MQRSDVPEGPHYVIMKVRKESVFHEADERSKQCPGHGYPAHTTEHEAIEYRTFPDTEEGRQEWEDELKKELFAHKMAPDWRRSREFITGFHVDLVARAKLDVELDITGEG